MTSSEAGKFARMGAGIVADSRVYERADGETWQEVFEREKDGWLGEE